MMVEAIRVVDVDVKRVDDSRLYYTRILSDKSDVDNFSKNVFLDLNSDVSYRDELL